MQDHRDEPGAHIKPQVGYEDTDARCSGRSSTSTGLGSIAPCVVTAERYEMHCRSRKCAGGGGRANDRRDGRGRSGDRGERHDCVFPLSGHYLHHHDVLSSHGLAWRADLDEAMSGSLFYRPVK